MSTQAKHPKQSSFRLRGVGPQMEKHLSRLDIHSIQDLLLHLPIRYQDRTRVEPIRQLVPGNDAVVEGVIHAIGRPKGGRTKLLCELRDDTGRLQLRFFHVLSYQADAFKPGVRLRCFSEVRLGPKGLEMVHPEFQVIDEQVPAPVPPHLTPVYPATEGLSQYMLRKLTTNALTWMENTTALDELLPAALLQTLSFPTLKEALKFVHRPPQEIPITHLEEHKTIPQKRLVFEELLAHRISLLQIKQQFQSQQSVAFTTNRHLANELLKQLAFKLTSAQQRVITEIEHDLSKSSPMLRLVQGDVGSGKTVVAAMAMLQAVESGYQAALMAPTELLAEQHYRVFKKWLEPLGIEIAFLSSHIKGSQRVAMMEAIAKGTAKIVIGTHALFQQDVVFAQLALVVVDEQHRFGVEQRAMFREKGMHTHFYPHQLIMTATPIPRTLAMSFYADLDCSVIDELPPGRTPIVTTVVAESKREEVIARIRDACLQGRQAYWVCPLIEESEVIACQAATKTSEQLQSTLSDLKVGLVHGRLSSSEKEKVMQQFQRGEINVLVATTVIEVGVDVPNASLMIIENAERLGLSQLHQLRGRVGRGLVASHCVLLYQSPLSTVARERLTVMRETTDGFKIAQRDLELRGPGEVFGTRQTGELSLRVADLLRDSELLPKVQQVADVIIREYPQVIQPLTSRWLEDKQEYGKI